MDNDNVNNNVEFPEPATMEIPQEGETVEEETVSVDELFAQLNELEFTADQAQFDVEQHLQRMVDELGGKTFQKDGHWFQIRCRYSKDKQRDVPYLAHLKDAPKTWLGGSRKKAAEATETETTPVEDTNDVILG